jgi:hypothetical protein
VGPADNQSVATCPAHLRDKSTSQGRKGGMGWTVGGMGTGKRPKRLNYPSARVQGHVDGEGGGQRGRAWEQKHGSRRVRKTDVTKVR